MAVHAGLSPGARALDVGCGAAELLVRLAERFGTAGLAVELTYRLVRTRFTASDEIGAVASIVQACADDASFPSPLSE